MKRLIMLATVASFSFAAIAQAQPKTILVPELTAQRRGTSEVVVTGSIKNNWEVAVPGTGLMYMAHMYMGKSGGADKWHLVGVGRAPALKPGQVHRFEIRGQPPANGRLIRVLVRGKVKETDTALVDLAFADFTLPAPVQPETVVPDLGVVTFHGAATRPTLGPAPVLVKPGTQELFVKVKNYGHQSALVDYEGGRTWKLYRLNGSKWELIVSDKIAALKVRQERTIDLLQYLIKKDNANLQSGLLKVGPSFGFAAKGTRWHFVISGGDANTDNDYKTLHFK